MIWYFRSEILQPAVLQSLSRGEYKRWPGNSAVYVFAPPADRLRNGVMSALAKTFTRQLLAWLHETLKKARRRGEVLGSGKRRPLPLWLLPRCAFSMGTLHIRG